MATDEDEHIKVTRVVTHKGAEPGLKLSVDINVSREAAGTDADLGRRLSMAMVRAIKDKARHTVVDDLQVAKDAESACMLSSETVSGLDNEAVSQVLCGAQLVMQRIAGQDLEAALLVWPAKPGSSSKVMQYATSAPSEPAMVNMLQQWINGLRRPRA